MVIEFDLETTGLQWPYHEAFCYQFKSDDRSELIWVGDTGWRERVQYWLDRGAEEGIRAWNSRFDLHFGANHGFTLPPEDKWHDGMIVAHVLDERRSVALKNVGAGYGLTDGADLQKEVKGWLAAERKRRKDAAKEAGTELVEPNFSDVPRDLMYDYALEDVELTRKVCDLMDPMLAKVPDLVNIVEFEREVLAALYHVERRGFPVDEEGYRKLEIELAENLEAMDERLNELAGDADGAFNPKSSKQVLDALKRRGADLSFVTNESMDKENLETVEDELAQAVLDFRSEYKILSTYVRPMIGRSYETSIRSWKEQFIAPDGRVHASYRQLGARTGRMCIAEGTPIDGPRNLLKHPLGVPIECIQEGDTVYSHGVDGVPRPKRVLKTFNQGEKRVLKLVWRAAGNKSYLGELKATAGHRVRLRDGSYRRMDMLQPGDQLTFLSRQVTGDGYSKICWQHGTGNGVASAVDEHKHLLPESEISHHQDENKLNNALDNLEAMTVSQHCRHHNPIGVKRPERNKTCPYSRDKLKTYAEAGILWCIQNLPHDYRTMKRWFSEADVVLPDRRVTNHVVVAVIDEDESLPTYDLEVEDTHCFVANEIGVHNSCSDPNIQNQPRDDLRLRYNFRAEPGYKLVTCDLNSVEMAVFAAYAGEGRLMTAIKEGVDIHTMTAEFVGIRDRARAGGHIESARQRGKTFNFAVVYGAGVRSIRKMMRCNQAEARLYLKRYHDAYPEVGRLQARVEWRLQDTGYIKSAWGRRFRLEPREAYRAVNYLVQGTAAEILKASLIRLHKEGVPVVALVHDEIICSVPEKDAEECKQAVIAALTEHPQITDKIPLTADGCIVDRWSQAKDPNFVPKWAQ